MNKQQFGFTSQKSTIDAAMSVKKFISKIIIEGNAVIVVSLVVQGTFDEAWWPSILYNIKEMKCPRNLFNLTQNYFTNRTAILETNSIKLTRDISKGCPQGSCCGPGLWNILYNPLLHLIFTKYSQVETFADDLLVLIRGNNHKTMPI